MSDTQLVPQPQDIMVNVSNPETVIDAYRAKAADLVTDDQYLDVKLVIDGIGVPTNQKDADELGIASVRIGSYKKTLQEFWAPPKGAFFAMHRLISGAEKETLKRWEDLDTIQKAAVLSYRNEQRRLEAERLAADEKRRQQQAAELAAQAKKLMKSGEIEEADKIQQTAAAIATSAPVQAAPTRVVGQAFQMKWVGTITDPMAVVKAIAAGVIPIDVIKEFNQSFIDSQAAVMKRELNWPGIAVDEVESVKRTGR